MSERTVITQPAQVERHGLVTSAKRWIVQSNSPYLVMFREACLRFGLRR